VNIMFSPNTITVQYQTTMSQENYVRDADFKTSQKRLSVIRFALHFYHTMK